MVAATADDDDGRGGEGTIGDADADGRRWEVGGVEGEVARFTLVTTAVVVGVIALCEDDDEDDGNRPPPRAAHDGDGCVVAVGDTALLSLLAAAVAGGLD